MKDERRFRRQRTRTAGDAALARGMTCSRSDHTWRLIASVASGQSAFAHTMRRAEAGVGARGQPPIGSSREAALYVLETPAIRSAWASCGSGPDHKTRRERGLEKRDGGSDEKDTHALCRGQVAGALFGSARLLRRLRSRLLFHAQREEARFDLQRTHTPPLLPPPHPQGIWGR
jgi:hypothetical protein